MLSSELTSVGDGLMGKRVGEEYEYIWNDRIVFRLSRIRERSGETKAEFYVLASNGGGEYARDRVNMVSLRSKNGFAKALHGKARYLGASDWEQKIEAICNETLEDYRHGEPTILLADVEDPGKLRYHFSEILPLGEPTVLYGDGESAKSLTAMFLACGAANGCSIPLFDIKTPATPVLYLDWETSAPTQRRRMGLVAKGLGVDIPRNIHYRYMAQALADDALRVKNDIDKYGVGMVVVDSMIPACGGEPESADVIRRFFAALRSCGPVTKVILSHISKASAQNSRKQLPTPFGSVFTRNLARSLWWFNLDKQERDNHVWLAMQHTKVNDDMNFGIRGLHFTFHKGYVDVEPYDPEQTEHGYAMMGDARKIEDFLKHADPIENKPGQPTSLIAKETGIGANQVRTVLGRMLKEGRVAKWPGGAGLPTCWGLVYRGGEP